MENKEIKFEDGVFKGDNVKSYQVGNIEIKDYETEKNNIKNRQIKTNSF